MGTLGNDEKQHLRTAQVSQDPNMIHSGARQSLTNAGCIARRENKRMHKA